MPPARGTSGRAHRGQRTDAPRRPGADHDLTGQVIGSPHHGALLGNWISEYASNYWHNLPLRVTMRS